MIFLISLLQLLWLSIWQKQIVKHNTIFWLRCQIIVISLSVLSRKICFSDWMLCLILSSLLWVSFAKEIGNNIYRFKQVFDRYTNISVFSLLWQVNLSADYYQKKKLKWACGWLLRNKTLMLAVELLLMTECCCFQFSPKFNPRVPQRSFSKFKNLGLKSEKSLTLHGE